MKSMVMQKKNLTQQQIQQLFEFCRNRYVYHYDLQVELVDHLASAIEEQWISNPEVPFEEALKNTFKKFGITGFSKVKIKKQKELTRKYNRLMWKQLLEYYRWPKMVITTALTLVLFTLFKFIGNALWITFGFFLLLLIFGLLYYYSTSKKHKIITIDGKKFLILEQLKQIQYLVIYIVPLPIHIFNLSRYSQIPFLSLGDWGSLFQSFAMVSFSFILYAQFFHIPGKIREHFMEQFGEFAIK